MKKSTWIVGGIVVLGVALLVWGGAQNAARPSGLGEEEVAELLAVREDDWTLGTTTPKAILVEYSDYQCPACRQYAPIVSAIMQEFGDRVQFTYRHFPLPQHFNAKLAASAAEAAGMQGKYFEMGDLLFNEQPTWQGLSREAMQEKVLEYATALELDIEQFAADLESEEIADSIAKDLADATRLGVNSTPTFYLNNKKIGNPSSFEAFRLLLLQELGDITIETQPLGGNEIQIEGIEVGS